MRRLEPVNLKLDSNMDADDYGQRLVDCVRAMNTDKNVINLVKIKVDENMKATHFAAFMEEVAKSLKQMGADNCVYVPVGMLGIKDITVDYIKVVEE